MSLVTTGVGAAVSAVRGHLERTMERASRDMVEDCLIETSKVLMAAIRALLAIALERNPSDEEVEDEWRRVAEDPASAHRVHRLFFEALKSPSAARRRRLAAVLAVGSKITKSEDELDRLDRMAEQLGEGEVLALKQIIDWRDAHPNFHRNDRPSCQVCQHRGDRVVLATLTAPPGSIYGKWETSGFIVDPVAIGRLIGAACLRRHEDQAVPADDGPDQYIVTPLQVTDVGEFFWNCLKHQAIQAGMSSGDPHEPE